MKAFNLLEIIQSDEGVENLLSSSLENGINIVGGPIIDFGCQRFIDIDTGTPLGYEPSDASKLNKVLTLWNSSKVASDIVLKEIRIVPENCSRRPNLTIDVGYDEDDSYLPFRESLVKESLQLKINLTISKDYTGFLGRFVVIRCERTYRQRLCCIVREDFIFGLRIVGSIVSSSISKELSLDAKPFIPNFLSVYFDEMVPLLNDVDGRAFIMTEKYATILAANGDRFSCPPPHPFFLEYRNACRRSDNLVAFAKSSGLDLSLGCIAGVIGRDSQRQSALVTLPVEEYLPALDRLAWCEEAHMLVDVASYDIYNMRNLKISDSISTDRGIKCLQATIKVVGSSEGRPRIAIGDRIRFRPTRESLVQISYSLKVPQVFMFELEGVISSYHLAKEKCQCNFYIEDPSSGYCGMLISILWPSGLTLVEFLNRLTYHVRFSFDRTLMDYLHQAVSDISGSEILGSVLFPKESYEAPLIPAVDVGHMRPTSILNEEQALAVWTVASLVRQKIRSPPFIIYGPPGTGKTTTVIEAILEVHRQDPQKRFLVCAPSDAAADVLAKRLITRYTTTELLRLNWWQRVFASLPIELSPYCCYKNDRFDFPSVSSLKSFKIVVSTCACAGSLLQGRTPQWRDIDQHFDVVCVDEASQAPELEAMIPLTLCKAGVMLLAGDPKQLEPTLRSPLYKLWGRPLSLQERLLLLPCYSFDVSENEEKKQSSLVVFLTKNYRSHQAILDTSSNLFYRKALVAVGSEDHIGSILPWKRLQCGKEFPLLFLGVNGQHAHALDSPSFYNLNEMEQVLEICQQLTTSPDISVRPADIGVICAFRSQVLKVRILLRKEHLHLVNVGSVEDFQGQETKVIIISTVLSSKVPSYEMSGYLGLYGNSRRFNVAITRGMALCVVVGHPYLLYSDPCWREYMTYCYKNGGYSGFECSLLNRKDGDQSKRLLEDSHDNEAALEAAVEIASLGLGTAGTSDDRVLMEYGGNTEMEWRLSI